jgi:hypothetical protein
MCFRNHLRIKQDVTSPVTSLDGLKPVHPSAVL